MKITNMKYLFMGAMALLLGGCGGEDDGMPSQPAIIELQVTPTSNRIPVGLEQQLVAQVKLSDDSVADVTTHPKVNWNSSAPNVAPVNNTGLITGISEGNAIIMASGTDAYGKYFESKVEVVVTAATVTELQVTPTTATMPAEFVQGFVATAHLSDGSMSDVTDLTGLTWSSSDPTVATISNDSATKGIATGVKPGAATITASGNVNNTLFQATAQLTVTDDVITSLQITTPATTNLPKELVEQFTATATLSDGSTRDVTNQPFLTWSSDNTEIATIVSGQVDGNGLATAVSPGLVTITASSNANNTSFDATAQLTVTDAELEWLEISPAPITNVPQGLTKPFTATATFTDKTKRDVTNDPFLSWSSSDPNIATIVSGQASGNGQATGIELGTVDIKAYGDLNDKSHIAQTQLTVDATVTGLSLTPNEVSIPKELTQHFIAIAELSNDTTQNVTNNASLRWSSSNPKIATVVSGQDSGNGLVTAVAAGTVTITASGTSANGAPFSATAELTVLDAVMTSLTIAPQTNQLVGAAKQVTTITELLDGSTKQFTAIAELSDGSSRDVSNNLTWSSSDLKIARVVSGLDSGNGLVGGIDMGPVTISASGNANGEPLSADATLTVIQSTCDGVQLDGVGCFKMPRNDARYWTDAEKDCLGMEDVVGVEVGYTLPPKDSLVALYAAYPNDRINILWGWPNGSSYWSGTMADTGNHYSVSLKSGKVYDYYNSVNTDKLWIGAYVTCMRK